MDQNTRGNVYFKVVRTTTTRGVYRSYCFRINNKLDLIYESGKTTVPNIGKIFVFDTLENANRFLDGEGINDQNNTISILKVVVGGTPERLELNIPSYEKNIEEYWLNSKFVDFYSTCPSLGTFLVDSVTVLEDQCS